MKYEDAHRLLLVHAGMVEPTGDEQQVGDGIVGSLRPYTGLHEANFHWVMEALLSVGERVHREEAADRQLACGIWSICHTMRNWGLHPDGMLQRNKLIIPQDTERLESWVRTIETTALHLLGGWPPHRAVYYYARYAADGEWWDNHAFFVSLMVQAVADPRTDDALETIVASLGKLGPLASDALPALRAAERRNYMWYTPEDRCTNEVRGLIRQAINAIEVATRDGSSLTLPASP